MFPQSVLIGVPSHLLLLVHCVFKSRVVTAIYQEILEHFMLPSADNLSGNADFLFQKDSFFGHWFADHGITVRDWPANSPSLDRDELKAAAATLSFHNTSAVQQADCRHAMLQ